MGYKNSKSLPIEGDLVQSSFFCGTSDRQETPQYCRRCYVGMYVCFLIFWYDEMIEKQDTILCLHTLGLAMIICNMDLEGWNSVFWIDVFQDAKTWGDGAIRIIKMDSFSTII